MIRLEVLSTKGSSQKVSIREQEHYSIPTVPLNTRVNLRMANMPVVGMVSYKGQFAAGQYHGAGEKFDDVGLLVYSGEFANGSYHGKGKAFHPDGYAYYDGKFVNGLEEGLGTLLDSDENALFKGYFLAGNISLESFLGLSSGKLEEILGPPADILFDETALAIDGTDEEAVEAAEDVGSLPPLPSTVEYSYAPMQLSFTMNIPAAVEELPTASEVRIWNPQVLSRVMSLLENEEPLYGDKTDPTASLVDRVELTDGNYELQFFKNNYSYIIRYNAADRPVMLEIGQI
jgi:hypothetical protein